MPGSHNSKNRKAPILVTAQLLAGGPLTMAEVADRLDEYGIVERPDDRAVTGAEISPPAGWTFARRTCPYVAAMIARWPTDRPNGGRNPYVYSRPRRVRAAKANAETLFTEVTSFVAAPATVLALSTLKEYGTAGSNKPLLQSDPTAPVSRQISGIPLYSSPAVAADIVWAIPAQRVLFVVRQDATVVSDTSVMFTSDRVAIRCTMRVSYAFTQPMAITKITKA